MLEKIQINSTVLKYITRSHVSSLRTRQLTFNAFILPYFQLIYATWPLLSNGTIAKIESKNRQIYRLIHNWWDAHNDEVQWLPAFQTATSRAQRFLRRFIDKAQTISPELFEFYILSKAMPMYLQMHFEETQFIDALPRARIYDKIGPEIIRKAISQDKYQIIIETFLVLSRFCESRCFNAKTKQMYRRHRTKIEEIKSNICNEHLITPSSSYHSYSSLNQSDLNWKLIDEPSDLTLEDIVLTKNTLITCKPRASLTHNASSFSTWKIHYTPGLCDLSNSDETNFMNSVL
ncbi:unnamed protein product [Rotaria sp. Silwood1]|nr:unnamed protein product [Rotaria sp. Silwood1]